MIPDYQTLMGPVLREANAGEISVAQLVDKLANEFKLTPEERAELLPSGGQITFANRIHWAKTYLKQAGLLTATKRGHFTISDRGRTILSQDVRVDNQLLRTFPEFQQFQARGKTSREARAEGVSSSEDLQESETPEEAMRAAYEKIVSALAAEMIDRLQNASPPFFERTIVSLLLAMGYGGSSEDAGQAIGQSGDDGIDGVIDQDPLGVDQIYVQAKRYGDGNVVGPAAIRDFFGSLNLKRAQKGIFVTTSSFSKSAIETARQIGGRIVLIDAQQLGRLLVLHNVGVRDQAILHVKRVDEDFFE